MKKLLTGLSISLTVLLLASGTSFAQKKKLLVTGSSTMAPVISEIAKLYEKANPDVRIDVQTGGSTRGINDVTQGLAGVGMSSRDLSKKESKGLTSATVATDGVAFVINIKNPVENLSTTQIERILKGEVARWVDVGGKDKEIVFINRAKGRSELELISEFFKIPAEEIKAELIAGENQEVIKLVSQNKDAISYMSLGTAQSENTGGAKIKLPNLSGAKATREFVMTKSYPLVRPLVLLSKNKADELSQKFIEFCLSKEAQDLFEQNNFVRAQ